MRERAEEATVTFKEQVIFEALAEWETNLLSSCLLAMLGAAWFVRFSKVFTIFWNLPAPHACD